MIARGGGGPKPNEKDLEEVSGSIESDDAVTSITFFRRRHRVFSWFYKGAFLAMYLLSFYYCLRTAGADRLAGLDKIVLDAADDPLFSLDGPMDQVLMEQIEALPSMYAPTLPAVLAFFFTVAGHALFYLMQRWSLDFKCLVSLREVLTVKDADFVKVRHSQSKASSPFSMFMFV